MVAVVASIGCSSYNYSFLDVKEYKSTNLHMRGVSEFRFSRVSFYYREKDEAFISSGLYNILQDKKSFILRSRENINLDGAISAFKNLSGDTLRIINRRKIIFKGVILFLNKED